MAIALHCYMDWLTWYPSIQGQHAAFAAALLVMLVSLLMAVPRHNRRKPI
jgi:hypothetical protein